MSHQTRRNVLGSAGRSLGERRAHEPEEIRQIQRDYPVGVEARPDPRSLLLEAHSGSVQSSTLSSQQEKGEPATGLFAPRQSVFNESRWQLARAQSSPAYRNQLSRLQLQGQRGQGYF